MMNTKYELSIVIPVFNEEENITELLKRTLKACDDLDSSYEIILVDDGSSDLSAKMISLAAREHPDRVKGVFLATNFGQHAAVTAGLQTASGDYVITMDADLQNPPEEIHKLLAKLREGYDVVGTIRANRRDTPFRKLASHIVNFMVRKLCHGRTMRDYGCMLRGYSRPVVNAILKCSEHGKFIPMLAMSFGRRVTEIEVEHAERSAGQSKYSFWKLIALQYDLLTGTSTFSLRLLTIFGFLLAISGIIFGIAIFIFAQIDKNWGAEGVFALFAIEFVFMGGVFAALGLIGEYIGKIHLNTRARPQFVIASTTMEKSHFDAILHTKDRPEDVS